VQKWPAAPNFFTISIGISPSSGITPALVILAYANDHLHSSVDAANLERTGFASMYFMVAGISVQRYPRFCEAIPPPQTSLPRGTQSPGKYYNLDFCGFFM
jgi:hypothetical protein